MLCNCQKVLPSHDIKKFRAPVRSESGAPGRSEKRISKIEAGGHPRIVLLRQTSENQAKTNSCARDVRFLYGPPFELIVQLRGFWGEIDNISYIHRQFFQTSDQIFQKTVRWSPSLYEEPSVPSLRSLNLLHRLICKHSRRSE